MVGHELQTHQKSIIVLTAPKEIIIDDLAFSTGNDIAGRDPVSLRIDGSRNGKDWVVLHDTREGFPTPLTRRCWSPWLSLEVHGAAPYESMINLQLPGVVRHRCCVKDCTDSFANKEGYLTRGKLLTHMLCMHPSDDATKTLEAQLDHRSNIAIAAGSVCGSFAHRSFIQKKCCVAVSHQLVPPLASAMGSSDRSHLKEPITPTRSARQATVGVNAVSKGSCSHLIPSPPLSTPSRLEPPMHVPRKLEVRSKRNLGNLSGMRKGCPVTVLRLSAIAHVSAGSLVDVGAVVKNVGALKQKTSRRRPGVPVNLRRLVLQDGSVSCVWALWGVAAERYGDILKGRRVVVRCAKVHAFNSTRCLSGCVHVDMC